MEFLNSITSSIIVNCGKIYFCIDSVACVLFFLYRRSNEKKNNVDSRFFNAIPYFSYLSIMLTSILSLFVSYANGDNYDGEGLATLLLVPYMYILIPLVAIVSAILFLIVFLDKGSAGNSTAVIITVALTVLGSTPIIMMLLGDPVCALIITAAKLIAGGTGIYYLIYKPTNRINYSESIYFEPFNNDNKKGE